MKCFLYNFLKCSWKNDLKRRKLLKSWKGRKFIILNEENCVIFSETVPLKCPRNVLSKKKKKK